MKIAIPPKESLELLYVEQQKSLLQVGREFRVSAPTVKNWLRWHQIPLRVWDPKAPKPKAIKSEHIPQPPSVEETTILNEETVAQEYESPAKLATQEVREISPTHKPLTNDPLDEHDDDDGSAFSRCSRRQQVALLNMNLEAPLRINAKNLADAANTDEGTARKWLSNKDFRDALKERSDEAFSFYQGERLKAVLVELLESGKCRPEDRKLLADITGLTKSNMMLVNNGTIFAFRGRF